MARIIYIYTCKASIEANATASSEAIFGSSSRGDSDRLSDRDILIVDDNLPVLKERAATLRGEGWSVAPYTFGKLDAMSRKASLFIQHLKLEARIIRDDTGRLARVLEAFRPRSSYADELLENANLAKLAARRPESNLGALWAADVLYVTLRNFGILYLAGKQRYVFGFEGLVVGLADEGLIEPSEIERLILLRHAKASYRSSATMAPAEASTILARALKTLPTGWFPAHSLPLRPETILAATVTLPVGAPPYARLRNLERAYVALVGTGAIGAQAELDTLLQWVRDPRAYASVAARCERALIHQMKLLAGAREMV